MFNLLVVDDEEYAVLGIARGIDWSELGIGQVFEAYGAAEAMERLRAAPVDIMICDIEMPGISGLELVQWANAHSPQTKTLFLTGHANFSYAQQAVHLDCAAFVLKPVEHVVLKNRVAEMMDSITQAHELANKLAMYNKYHALFEAQKMHYAENFWQDMLGNRLNAHESGFAETFETLGIPMDMSGQVLLILIKIEKWTEGWNARDKAIMKLAARNTAGEMILAHDEGIAIEDREGDLAVIVYAGKEAMGRKDELMRKCERFLATCRQELNGHLTCYVGNPVPVRDIAESCRQLRAMETNNITRMNCVLFQSDDRQPKKGMSAPPSFINWSMMLEAGKRDELEAAMLAYLDQIDKDDTPKELLDSFCYGMIHMVYALFHKKGMLTGDAFINKAWMREGVPASNIRQAGSWAVRLITEAVSDLSRGMTHQSAIVTSVKKRIESRVYAELSREELAAEMNYNPDYLSRVFKRETGMILSDYIAGVRMNEARRRIMETNETIGDIAEKLGYTQLSYFAKVFKSYFGVSPSALRKTERP